MTTSPAPGDSPVATTADPLTHAVAGEHTAECGGVKCGGPHCPPPDSHAAPMLHAVHLDVNLVGDGTVTVDGHDLSHLVARGGVTIQAGDQKTRVTKVYLELMAGATYDGPAEVTVVQGAHAVEFLQSVNPAELSKASLRGGFNRNPVDVMLEVLIGWAQAIAPPVESE